MTRPYVIDGGPVNPIDSTVVGSEMLIQDDLKLGR